MTSNALRLRQRILIPSFIAFALIAVFVVGSVVHQQNQQLKQEIKHRVVQTKNIFSHSLRKDAEFYTSLINNIAKNKPLQQAWLKQDRQQILNIAQQIYGPLNKQHRLTHFYFHDNDGINVLRVHAPLRYGDKIDRHTFKQAQTQGMISSGIEVGPFGWFVLRVVKPWIINGQIVGYLEIGEEIDHIVNDQARHLQEELIITIPKALLSKERWEMTHPNPRFPWDILQNEIISSSSQLTPSVKLLRAIADKSTLENRIFSIEDKHYQIAHTPLKDAAGGDSGTLHVIIDISEQITRQRNLSLTLITAAAGIGGLLTLMFYMIVIRLEQELQHNYQKLEKEIEERRIAQGEATKLKEELEQRIESRTAQLQRLNHQLIQDNENHRQTQLALTASEERYRTLFDASGIAMALLDRDSITECNDTFVHMFGYQSHEELLNRNPAILSPEMQPSGEGSIPLALNEIKKAVKLKSHKFEWLFKRADDTTFPAEISLTIVKYGERNFIHAIVQDITERKKAESKVIQHAYFDTLTGLPNRNLFMDRLEQALEHNKRAGIQGSVLFADLDHFKNVNDSLGHEKGDLLLKEVAKRLRQAIRKEDTVARFGGDEFVILLPDIHENYDKAIRTTQRIADKISKSFERPFKVKPYEFHLTPSIGATLFPAESDNLDDILKHADAAMYQAKASGRNTVRFFEQNMQQSLEQRLLMEKDLRLALKRQEFSLVFQPQVDNQQKIIGAETLVRWTHPKRGPVSPADFIPVAEETGLIIQLGKWILEESLSFLQRLSQSKATKNDLHLSINISPLQFRQSDMVADFSNALSAREISPEFLTLEITEGILMDDIADSSTKLEQLKEIGFRVSIDDFGTGYSSLAYLKQLNIDELKVDQSFIRDISSDPNDAAIVEAIISMSHHLGLRVVAEGVEEHPQLVFLTHQHCDAFQGYYFYKPMAEAEFIEALKKTTR
ncbi:hypothetical protein R50073_22160 [Maricurvus nonylphenolicus]|uniref:bifunctional diguanylate cyclase/phosphodiesterase n=1 Tax=Maricurvus nonylphenolicus TaxID=1008307 RepID=UPI0036F33519